MTKLFNIATPVFGESFIGREKELLELERNSWAFLDQNSKFCLSLTGMKRIGKSSLVKELFKRREEACPNDSCFTLFSSFDNASCFWNFWRDQVIMPLLDVCEEWAISENHPDRVLTYLSRISTYFRDDDKAMLLYEDGRTEDTVAKNHFANLLKLINVTFKKHIVLAIDEFDKAEQFFGNEYNFSWLRGILQNTSFSLSAIIISRRSIENIEKGCFSGSTLAGIFNRIPIMGYTNQDIDLFLRELESRTYPLTNNQREDLWFFCGRSPYFLSIIGNKIINSQKENWDIQEVATDFVSTNYMPIIKVLKEEELLVPMLQMFVGPVYNLRASQISTLISLGYALSAENIVARGQIEEFSDYITGTCDRKFYTICQHFERYLEEVCESELSNIWGTLMTAEKALRIIVRAGFESKYGANWQEKFIEVTKDNSVSAHGSYNTNLIWCEKGTAMGIPKKNADKLKNNPVNMLTVELLKRVIIFRWDLFEKYFSVPAKTLNEWLEIVYLARCPLAHANGEVLTQEIIEKTNKICTTIIQIKNNLQP